MVEERKSTTRAQRVTTIKKKQIHWFDFRVNSKDFSPDSKLPEMEFLDISLCSMLFTVFSTGIFERKPYSSLVLKILTKISAKQENSSLFMNSIFVGKMSVESQTKTRF
jgi:hypothetical protein